MTSFPAVRASWTFLRRHRTQCLLLGLVLFIAVGEIWSWCMPPQPRTVLQSAKSDDVCILSPDSRIFLGLSQKRGLDSPVGPVRLWDAATGEERPQILSADDKLSVVRLSPDGRWLAVEDGHGEVTLWNAMTGKLRAALPRPARAGTGASRADFQFSADSRLLAYGEYPGGGIVLWDLAAGKLRAELRDARLPVSFSPDGLTLATAAADKTPRLWQVTNGQERVRLGGSTWPVAQLTFSPDGRLLLTLGNEDVTIKAAKLWEVSSGRLWAELARSPPGPTNTYYNWGVAFSRDNRILVVPGSGPPLWDLSTNPPLSLEHLIVRYPERNLMGITTLQPGPNPVFSPDGRWLALPGQQKGTFTILDTSTRSAQSVLSAQSNGQWCGAPVFSPDGEIAAVSAGYQKPAGLRGLIDRLRGRPVTQENAPTVKLFEVTTGRLLGEVPGRMLMGFAADGRSFFTSGRAEDSADVPTTVYRWDVPSGHSFARPLMLGVLVILVWGVSRWRSARSSSVASR
jgi:WD40 repeat protein